LQDVEREAAALVAEARRQSASLRSESGQRLREEVHRIYSEAEEEARVRCEEALAETRRLMAVYRAELEGRIADFVNEAVSLVLPSPRGDSA